MSISLPPLIHQNHATRLIAITGLIGSGNYLVQRRPFPQSKLRSELKRVFCEGFSLEDFHHQPATTSVEPAGGSSLWKRSFIEDFHHQTDL